QINNTTTTDLIDKVESEEDNINNSNANIITTITNNDHKKPFEAESDNVNTKKHKRNITDKNIVPNKEHKR
ncbi:18930_t:CDS:1, partial [Entrophospora sp. SA101]